MKNNKSQTTTAVLTASQVITARDVEAMIAYLKNFDLKYRSNKRTIKK